MILFKNKTLVITLCILMNQSSIPLTNALAPTNPDQSIRMRRGYSMQMLNNRHSGNYGSLQSKRYSGAMRTTRKRKSSSSSLPFQILHRNSASINGSTGGSNSGGYSELFMKKEDSTTIPILRSRRSFDSDNANTSAKSMSSGSTSTSMNGTTTSSSSKKDYSLSAASLFSESFATTSTTPTTFSFEQLEEIFSKVLPHGEKIMPVISAALLITSTTVGASMMVLPGLAQGPGMIVSSGLIGAVYIINLMSGLLIAEVAINQYEASSCEVPSSFKEFADVNLQSNLAGNFVSSVSLFINTCVLSYDLVTAGRLTNQFIINNDAVRTVLGSDIMKMASSNQNIGLMVAATFFVGLVSTQSGTTLSLIASVLCMMLFASFAGMVLPGIAMIHDPLATFAAQGTSEFGSEVFMNDVATFVPVLLTAMVYQNIVPTITKMLKYDRAQTVQAIIFGSAIPMFMYIAFCFTVLSGGALPGVGSGNIFLTGITASSVFGSAMACVISIAEELDVYFEDKSSTSECEVDAVTGGRLSRKESKDTTSEETASFSSVALGVLVPTLAGIFFADGDGFVKALSISGSYGSPLLYGVIPVILAFSQRTAIMKEFNKDGGILCKLKVIMNKALQDDTDREKQLAPAGMFGIGALAAGAATVISTHAIDDLSSLIAASSQALS